MIGGDGFRFRHGHIGGIDAAFAPDALVILGVGHGRVAQRVVRQVDFHLGNDAFVVPGLVLRLHHDEFLRGELAGRRILVPGHQGGAIIGCVFSHKQGCARHSFFFLSFQ